MVITIAVLGEKKKKTPKAECKLGLESHKDGQLCHGGWGERDGAGRTHPRSDCALLVLC